VWLHSRNSCLSDNHVVSGRHRVVTTPDTADAPVDVVAEDPGASLHCPTDSISFHVVVSFVSL